MAGHYNSVCFAVNSCSCSGLKIESSVSFVSIEATESPAINICCGVPTVRLSSQRSLVGCKLIFGCNNLVSSFNSSLTRLNKLYNPMK